MSRYSNYEKQKSADNKKTGYKKLRNKFMTDVPSC